MPNKIKKGSFATALLLAGDVLQVDCSGRCIVDRYTDPSNVLARSLLDNSRGFGPYTDDYGFKIAAISSDAEIRVKSDNEPAKGIDPSFKVDQHFIIGGQSNADGFGELPAVPEVSHPSTYLYNKNNEYTLLTEPAGIRGPNWVNNAPEGNPFIEGEYSFATQFGKNVINMTSVVPLIVPNAIGGTDLDEWVDGVDDENDDITKLFGAMVIRTKEVASKLSNNHTQPIFLWYGHEGNASQVGLNLSTGVIGDVYMNKWLTLTNEIRKRFPDSPILFAQLAGSNVGPDSFNNLWKGAESQRLSEDVYGDGDLSNKYVLGTEPYPVDDSEDQWVVTDSDVDNYFEEDANGDPHMVSTGSTTLFGRLIDLEIGVRYRVTTEAIGTGFWKLWDGDVRAIGAQGRTAGIYTDTVNLESPLGLRYGRNGLNQAGDFVFKITVEKTIRPLVPNTHMVVTHDLPRNAPLDGTHVSTAGHKILGRRFALAYAERVLGMPWINGTGPRLVSVTSESATVVRVTFNKEIKADTNNYGVDLASSLFRMYDDGVEKTLTSVVRGSDTSTIDITTSSANSGTVVITYGDRAGEATPIMRRGVVYDNDDMPAPMFGPIVAE